jgi:hypothetical protein
MCEDLATLHPCTSLYYNVNCLMSKITAIVSLSSFMLFKEIGMCERFIFDMNLVFIYKMSSFRCMKGTRTKEGFPHCLHPLGLSCLRFVEYDEYWIECRFLLILYIYKVSLNNVTGNYSYPWLFSLV